MSDTSRLLQAGEECAELIAAIFEYLRKMSADNPTPKSEEEILHNITEEIMDVQLSLDTVGSNLIDYDIYTSKLNRWVKRLKQKE